MKEKCIDYIRKQLMSAPAVAKGYTNDLNNHAYHPRDLYYTVLNYIDQFTANRDSERWVIIPGLRGVGKTTLLAQIYSNLRKTVDNSHLLFISMDEAYNLHGYTLQDIIESYELLLGQSYAALEQKIYIFIDEVQADKRWSLILKTLLYNKSKNVFILITGSSAVSLQVDADVSRRAVFEKMYPLNFCELQLIKNNLLPEKGLCKQVQAALFDSVSAEDAFVKLEACLPAYRDYTLLTPDNEYEKFIMLENLPFAVNRDRSKVYENIRLLIDKVINFDIRDLAKFDVDTLSSIKRLLYLLADSLDSPSLAKLSARSGIKTITLMNVLEVLERAELLIKIPPHGSNMTKSRKPSKYLFMSPAFRMSLLDVTGDISTYLTRQGKLIEDITASYLFREFIATGRGSVSYDPSVGGADFILEIDNKRKIIIEVGRGEKNNKQIYKSAEKVKCDYGIVISSSNEIIEVKDNILKIPFRLFLIS